MTYSFGFVEVCHLDVAPVMSREIEEVEGKTGPEVETRHPCEDRVLKALGKVRVAGVPCDIPILGTQAHAKGNCHTMKEQGLTGFEYCCCRFKEIDHDSYIQGSRTSMQTSKGQ